MPSNPNKQNQDSFIVNPKLGGSYSRHLFGVADGHGQFGKEVSSLVKEKYPIFLAENLKSFNITDSLVKAFGQASAAINENINDIEFSGSTTVMVYIDGQDLYTANVGDSRAILGSFEKGGNYK